MAQAKRQAGGGQTLDPKLIASFRTDPAAFCSHFFNISFYDWQKKVMAELSAKKRVCLKAANGSGKTSHVAAPILIGGAVGFLIHK